MANKKKQIDRNAFEHLKKVIIEISGVELDKRGGYKDLEKFISENSQINFPPKRDNEGKRILPEDSISCDTLRRYWGVKDGGKGITPDTGKLSLIAQSIGYLNWKDFAFKYNNGLIAIDNNEPIAFSNPKEISMCWAKGETKYFGTYEKYIGLKAIDDFEFVVTKSINTKMKKGETIMLKDIEIEQNSRLQSPSIRLISFFEEEEDVIL